MEGVLLETHEYVGNIVFELVCDALVGATAKDDVLKVSYKKEVTVDSFLEVVSIVEIGAEVAQKLFYFTHSGNKHPEGKPDGTLYLDPQRELALLETMRTNIVNADLDEMTQLLLVHGMADIGPFARDDFQIVWECKWRAMLRRPFPTLIK